MPKPEMVMMTEGFRLLHQNLCDAWDSGKLSQPQAEAMAAELEGTFKAARGLLSETRKMGVGPSIIASAIHEAVDMAREKFDRQTPLSKQVACKRGCAACCYIRVGATRDEAALIAEHVQAGKASVDRKRLAEQAEAEKQDTTAYLDSKRPCVFLGADQACTIYGIRPGACRNYRVLFDSSNCGGEPGQRVALLCAPQAEAFLSAAYNESDVDGLATLVQQELEKSTPQDARS